MNIQPNTFWRLASGEIGYVGCIAPDGMDTSRKYVGWLRGADGVYQPAGWGLGGIHRIEELSLVRQLGAGEIPCLSDHTWVDVGFYTSHLVCSKCNTEMKQPQEII